MLAWTPVITQIGPLYQEAENVLKYSSDIVKNYLMARMFRDEDNAETKAKKIAEFFKDVDKHLSHSRRIDKEVAKQVGVKIIDLESDQELQDAVLTAYHLISIIFERTTSTKILANHAGKMWIKTHISLPSAGKPR